MAQLGALIDNLYAFFALSFLKLPFDILDIFKGVMEL